jgi:hypothetical protein
MMATAIRRAKFEAGALMSEPTLNSTPPGSKKYRRGECVAREDDAIIVVETGTSIARRVRESNIVGLLGKGVERDINYGGSQQDRADLRRDEG